MGLSADGLLEGGGTGGGVAPDAELASSPLINSASNDRTDTVRSASMTMSCKVADERCLNLYLGSATESAGGILGLTALL